MPAPDDAGGEGRKIRVMGCRVFHTVSKSKPDTKTVLLGFCDKMPRGGALRCLERDSCVRPQVFRLSIESCVFLKLTGPALEESEQVIQPFQACQRRRTPGRIAEVFFPISIQRTQLVRRNKQTRGWPPAF